MPLILSEFINWEVNNKAKAASCFRLKPFKTFVAAPFNGLRMIGYTLSCGHTLSQPTSTYGFDVLERVEIQLVTYQSDELGHYDWHHDVQWYGQSPYDRNRRSRSN